MKFFVAVIVIGLIVGESMGQYGISDILPNFQANMDNFNRNIQNYVRQVTSEAQKGIVNHENFARRAVSAHSTSYTTNQWLEGNILHQRIVAQISGRGPPNVWQFALDLSNPKSVPIMEN